MVAEEAKPSLYLAKQEEEEEAEHGEEEETLSLRDLPLTATNIISSNKGSDDHHEEEVFEFFKGGFNPCSPSEDDDSMIIFCGKIIPSRGSIKAEAAADADDDDYVGGKKLAPQEDLQDKMMDTKGNCFRQRSSSLTEPRSSSNPNHRQQVTRLWSLPSSSSSSRRGGGGEGNRVVPWTKKSRWYMLAFGVGNVPAVKMELKDMKFRQSRKMMMMMSTGAPFNNTQQQEEELNRSKSRKGSTRLLGILGCNREEATSMVKSSLVCV